MWILYKIRFSKCEFLSKIEVWKMWILLKMSDFENVNSVFSFIFSEIPEVLLLKILFSPSFSVKFQKVFLLKILFFSSFPVKSQRFFCSKFKFSKKSRQKSHKIWPKSMSWQWQFWHSVMTRCPQKNPEIQCSACKASFEKAQNLVNGDNMCVSHNNLRL